MKNFDFNKNIKPITQTEPLPLMRSTPQAIEYPKDALLSLKPAVDAIHAAVGAPYAMCANSILAGACLAVQAHGNIQMPIGSPKPISCFFISVGKSGERKTACDAYALKAIGEKEKALCDEQKQEHNAWRIKKDLWDKERQTIIKSKASQIDKEADLRALGAEPEEPVLPMLVFAEPTYHGLHKYLHRGYPSVGLFSSEGGQFVGGHAMRAENKLETAAGFNAFWDGEPLKRIRVTDGNSVAFDKRLSMHLMMQHDVAISLLSDNVVNDTGLTARMLVTYPQTTQGTRFNYTISQDQQRAIDLYNRQVRRILDYPLPLRTNSFNELEPRTISLSKEAQEVWIDFDRTIEKERGQDGYFSTIAGLANKMPEHAARLACVMALYDNIRTDCVDEKYIEAGIELVQYYAQQALNIQEMQAIDKDIQQAEKLWQWIKNQKFKFLHLAQIYQNAPDRNIRNAKQARTVMDILVEHKYLVAVADGMELEGKHRNEVWQVLNG